MRKQNLSTVVLKFKKNTKDFVENSGTNKQMALVALSLGLTACLVQFYKPTQQKQPNQEVLSLDTYIPNDQGLVTIQVSNYESLDQIIGQYGVVDLYSTPLIPGEKAKLVVKQVRLVRTQKSLRHFSVLLPAADVGILAGHAGEFTVSVRNPKLIGTKIVKDKRQKVKRRVYFESEAI